MATFPTTAWTLFKAAQEKPPETRSPELNTFISRYWRPVFYFIRARGRDRHQAEDLTQEFFVRVLKRDLLAKVDPQRGRFRGFLRQNLEWFLQDPPRQQELFEQHAVRISNLVGEEDLKFEPAVNDDPERLFEKKWGQELLNRAIEEAARFCQKNNRERSFEVFKVRQEGATQEELAKRFVLTRDQVRQSLEFVRKRVEQCLRTELHEEGASEDEINLECQELFRVFEP